MKNVALKNLMAAAALTLVLAGGPLSVVPAGAQGSGKDASQDINAKKVTLNLENADIKYALKLLFQSVGANYTIEPGVQGTVTLALTDVSFRTALEAALKGSGNPLTYHVENSVYNISTKREQVDPITDVDPPEVTAPVHTTKTMKIPLNYADAIDIAMALGGSVIQSRFNMGQMGGQGNGFGNGFGNGQMGGNGNFGNFGSFGGGNGFGNNGFGSGFGNNGNSFGSDFGNNGNNGNNFGSGMGNNGNGNMRRR